MIEESRFGSSASGMRKFTQHTWDESAWFECVCQVIASVVFRAK